MSRVLSFLAALLLAAGLAVPRAAAQDVVVELFTSQGCSSCPPADALLARLAGEGQILALSLHVDYWDHLGWRDRFARPENTKRQKAYAGLVKARSIYTPQAVVQGQDRLVGSDEAALRRAIQAQMAAPQRARIELVPGADGILVRVQPLAEVHFERRGILHYITYDRPMSVRVDRGENAGLTLTYVNVVRDWLKLGGWDGKAAQTFTAPFPAMGRGVAVILQDGYVGPILAAARLEP